MPNVSSIVKIWCCHFPGVGNSLEGTWDYVRPEEGIRRVWGMFRHALSLPSSTQLWPGSRLRCLTERKLGVEAASLHPSSCGSLVAKLCLTLAVAHQAPLSMGFSRPGHWSGSPFPSLGDLPNPGIESGSPTFQVDDLPTELWGKPSPYGLWEFRCPAWSAPYLEVLEFYGSYWRHQLTEPKKSEIYCVFPELTGVIYKKNKIYEKDFFVMSSWKTVYLVYNMPCIRIAVWPTDCSHLCMLFGLLELKWILISR